MSLNSLRPELIICGEQNLLNWRRRKQLIQHTFYRRCVFLSKFNVVVQAIAIAIFVIPISYEKVISRHSTFIQQMINTTFQFVKIILEKRRWATMRNKLSSRFDRERQMRKVAWLRLVDTDNFERWHYTSYFTKYRDTDLSRLKRRICFDVTESPTFIDTTSRCLYK